ncbi:hypothetical protein [Mesorhizobium sp. M4A.F.Ca.ET.022.05.2.1]|nr:hypothetical protein [Mesorhizobium sp. M4A.F.Ca.ET.022.05.2.1]
MDTAGFGRHSSLPHDRQNIAPASTNHVAGTYLATSGFDHV